MSVTTDRAEILSRLRNSLETDMVIGAAIALKSFTAAIAIQNTRSIVMVIDCLDASLACISRFSNNEEVNEMLIQAVCTLATARKDFAQSVYSSGIVFAIISAMKSFPRNASLNMNSLRILTDVCTIDKRAATIVRLQGGLVCAVETLGQPCFDSDHHLTRLTFDFLSVVVKKSTASVAVITKVRGINFIVQAARRHFSNPRVFQSMLVLLDRLCTSHIAIHNLIDSGFVQLLLDALVQYKFVFKTFTVLMRMLRNVASHAYGAKSINMCGGFDAILVIIDHQLVKPIAVRMACSLLWNLQRHSFIDLFSHDHLYHFQSNFLPIKFPQDDQQSGTVDEEDGFASDDDGGSEGNLDEEADLGVTATAASDAPSALPDDHNWDIRQFLPELWHVTDQQTKDYFAASAIEISAANQPRSVRRMKLTPKCLSTMTRHSGAPGNDSVGIEHQYLAPQSLVLATMHAASDRFRNQDTFQGTIVYDRSLHDGTFLYMPAYQTNPVTVFGAPSTSAAVPTSEAPLSPEDDFDSIDMHSGSVGSGGFNGVPSLSFESRFECGNLFRVVRAGDTEYDLILSSDTNSIGRTQWFLFSVQHMRIDVPYKFNIINLEKPDSAFNRGMRPVMYSQECATRDGRGWFRVQSATDIAYFQNYFKKPHSQLVRRVAKSTKAEETQEQAYYYTLTFTMTFPHANDTVYMAHFYPFTFTFQRQCLSFLESHTAFAAHLRRQVLCYSRGGNAVDLLTITNFKSSMSQIQQRPVVVLTARIHPGETNASWVMKGVLEFLTGSSDIAITLRDNLVFKLIPMLNPDGVIEGNYRCSLSGHDQNRQWKNPHEVSSPVVFHAKRLMEGLARSRNLLLFCDFHGHSVASNFMMYGNDESECPQAFRPVVPPTAPLPTEGHPSHAWMTTVGSEFSGKERIFPAIVARRAFTLFSLEQCCFAVQKSRAGTARVVLWRELPLTFCFTLEATFNGSCYGPLKGLLFNTDHFEQMGQDFCRALADLIAPDQDLVWRAALEVGAVSAADSMKIRRRHPRRKATEKVARPPKPPVSKGKRKTAAGIVET